MNHFHPTLEWASYSFIFFSILMKIEVIFNNNYLLFSSSTFLFSLLSLIFSLLGLTSLIVLSLSIMIIMTMKETIEKVIMSEREKTKLTQQLDE